MSCQKEKPNNHQCRVCRIKHLVQIQGQTLTLPINQEGAVNWKRNKGNAWLGIPDTCVAHCGIGLLIVLSNHTPDHV